ncbi:hypothetical protein ST47_g2444 [Ascochyta rabiei]|uniref:Uncharacterized protein n=2 Tax=Didymella rabiei TaxID=5454 RepID=A0A163JKM0_DIDRA|nr:hypothetical protein ST47_g2444 [Ascochyta rabiei]
MKLSTSFVIIASVTSAMAGCYSGGQAWIDDCNKNAFRGAVRDLCKGTLSGYFDSPGKTKYACANSPCNGIRANFAVGWRGRSGGYSLAENDCVTRLNNEIDHCDHGGESTVADWFFQ